MISSPRVFFLFLLIILSAQVACASGSSVSTEIPVVASSEEFAVSSECVDFQKLVDQTYNFSPRKLSEAQQTAKSAEMDLVWEKVKADQSLLTCLIASLRNPNANKFFLFDGSTLLYGIDQSESTKQLVLQSYAKTDLGDIALQNWIAYPLRFGLEGLDTSATGDAWLRAENPFYYLPQHGTLKIDKRIGALAIYGSMDERFATPALAAIANQKDHPGRDLSVGLLMLQATPEAAVALEKLDLTGLSLATKSQINKFLTAPTFIKPRTGAPKVTREQYLSAFQELAEGKSQEFMKLVSEVSDGEKDAVAVLRDEDIPLVRKARRFFASTGSPHAPEWYQSFTDILMYMVRKPQVDKRRAT